MYIDLFLIILTLWAIFTGWRAGLIKEIFNLLGVIAGLLIAALVYLFFHKYLGVSGRTVDDVLSVVAFFILVIFLPIGLGFACGPLTRFVKEIKLGLPNSLFGAALSFVKFLLIVSFAFNTLESLRILNEERVATSRLYTPVREVLGIVKAGVAEKIQPSTTTPADTVSTPRY